MNLPELAFKQPVLTLDELRLWLDLGHSPNRRSREALVSYHLRTGRLLRVRRGSTPSSPAAATRRPRRSILT